MAVAAVVVVRGADRRVTKRIWGGGVRGAKEEREEICTDEEGRAGGGWR